MKNSYSRSDWLGLAPVAAIAVAAGWLTMRHGADWPVLALLLVAAVAALARPRPTTARPTADDRMTRLQQVVTEVAEGQVTGRITNIGRKDTVGELCWHVNNMLDQLESCFREQETVLRMAGEGRYFRKVQTAGLHGVFRQSLESTQHSIDALEENERVKAEHLKVERQAQQEIAELISAAARGDFGRRIEVAGKEGFFRQLADDLNTLSGTTESGLDDVARVLRALAQGDLTQHIDADYQGVFGQLKDDTNQTVSALHQTLDGIQAAAGSIRVAAEEISAGNADLSRRTESQASSLEQTAASMAELNATVKRNAEGAAKARTMADESRKRVLEGGQVMSRLVSTMSEIEKSSGRIADIVNLIESIAFQTNILALNAAVEAARAGEQGRGFAVGATEVRNLAQKSAGAAKEIKDLIDNSQNSVNLGVSEVRNVGTVIDQVVEAFEGLNGLVVDIAQASGEQAAGIDQVAVAMTHMEEVTQQNAALVEEAAAAAESLRDQVQGLDEASQRFQLGSGGEGAVPMVAA